MIDIKQLSCCGSEHKQNNKILENGKLPVMRDFVFFCKGINKMPSLFFSHKPSQMFPS